MNRVKDYLTALVLLTAMAVVYQNTLVPLIRPEALAAIPVKPPQSLRLDASLTDLFPAGSWQRGSCKVLQTADGMLLFENWEQTSAQQWRLWPVTVVMGRGMSSDKSPEPMILEANQGAEIKFSAPLDVLSGGAPPIERGRMVGPVHVFRKSTGAMNPADGVSRVFDLKTSNVGIDRRKMWTTDAITMQVGGAQLAGTDLTLHFAADPSRAQGDGHSILDRMELIYLDQLILPLGKGSVDQGTVSVLCNGRIEYDFALDHLTLSDQVSLVHQSATGTTDKFDCDRLQLWLNDPANPSIRRDGPMDWLNRLIATGDSSQGRPAAAELPTFDASISADRIFLDTRAGQFQASGKRGIRLRRGPFWAGLASIQYNFDPARPQAIGTLAVPGAGVVKIDDPNIAVNEAKWRGKLRVEPRGIAQFDHLGTDVDIHLEGGFSADFVDGGTFSADNLHAVLSPSTANATSQQALGQQALSQQALGQHRLDQHPSATASLFPSQCNATGHVRVDTSALVAETDFLRLLLVDEFSASTRSAPNQRPARSPMRQWVSQPQSETAGDDRPVEVPPARTRPHLSGDSIQAILRRDASGLSAKSLQVQGNVKVRHSLSTADTVLPVELLADRLRLLDGIGDDVLELTSGPDQPARFEIGDGFFVGPTIQIRPLENVIWIPQSGEFQIPTSLLSGLQATGTPPRQRTFDRTQSSVPVTWSQPPSCRWQGEMTFDGRTIELRGGVDITATMIRDNEQWDFDIDGDQMQVRLMDDVSLSNIDSLKTAQVQGIVINPSETQPVMIQAFQRGGDGVLETKHIIQPSQLSMTPGIANGSGGSPPSFRLIGSGPGWYRGWMRSRQTRRQPSGAVSDATMLGDISQPLTGVHLTFQQSMDVDSLARRLRLSDGIRVGIKPVSSWNDVFSADQMNSLEVDESTLDCEQLQLSVGPQSQSPGFTTASLPWEIQAVTGIVLRSRAQRGLLESTASRASYAASKDLFTLLGSPQRPAAVKQFTPQGQLRIDMAVKSAVIRPSTLEIESMEVESVNMAAPPNIARPTPGQFR